MRRNKCELIEAATTVGYPGGEQSAGKRKSGQDRSVFALHSHKIPLAVAISVGSNRFIVGMNRSSLEGFRQTIHVKDEDLIEIAS